MRSATCDEIAECVSRMRRYAGNPTRSKSRVSSQSRGMAARTQGVRCGWTHAMRPNVARIVVRLFASPTGPQVNTCSRLSTSRSARARMRPCFVRSKYLIESRWRWSNTSRRTAWSASTPARCVRRSSMTVIHARNATVPASRSDHIAVPVTSRRRSGPSIASFRHAVSNRMMSTQNDSIARPSSRGPLLGPK